MKYIAVINHFDEECVYEKTTVEDVVFDSRIEASNYIYNKRGIRSDTDGEFFDDENMCVITIEPKPFTLFEPGETFDIEELHGYVDPNLAQYTIINLNAEINDLKEKIKRLKGDN